MTEVLTPPQSDSPFGTQSLSRSSSQTALYLHGHDYKTAQPTIFPKAPNGSESKPIPSSPPNSPRLISHDDSAQTSLLSTPSSSLSLDDEYSDNELVFPNYDRGKGGTYSPVKGRASKKKQVEATKPTKKQQDRPLTMLDIPIKHNPSFVSMGDDAAIKKEPTRHVDYLSHVWREEDIWCSWRHVVAKRNDLENSARLENASWRSWAKTQKRLSTLSPESLNWMKDHDVTWLYGPLQTLDPSAFNPDSPTARSRLSRTNSFLQKKPILKRRSVSEAMLQRSLSNSTLVRQAVDCITSQEKTSPTERSSLSIRTPSRFSELITPPITSPYSSLTCTPIDVPSDTETPSIERKHIHFNDKVEQCIAVDKDGEDNDEVYSSRYPEDDESSDDEILMMQTSRGKERKLSNVGTASKSSPLVDSSSKLTIAMLPATTLKYRSDTPEPPERQPTPKASEQRWIGDRALHHSSSAETLKPTRPANNFLIDDDDEADLDWQPSSSQTYRSGVTHYSEGGIPLSFDESEDEELEARGMRRTASGMFMPYDGDESDAENSTIFGRVIDTVNTARDIAHVIWNVGWRR